MPPQPSPKHMVRSATAIHHKPSTDFCLRVSIAWDSLRLSTWEIQNKYKTKARMNACIYKQMDLVAGILSPSSNPHRCGLNRFSRKVKRTEGERKDSSKALLDVRPWRNWGTRKLLELHQHHTAYACGKLASIIR